MVAGLNFRLVSTNHIINWCILIEYRTIDANLRHVETLSRIITIYWNEYYRLDEKIDLMYFLKGVEICHLLISYLTWYSKNAHQTKRATHTVTLKLKRDRVEEKIESARERERERERERSKREIRNIYTDWERTKLRD